MDDFLAAALGFPAVVFSFALVVVVAYWLLVLVGGVDSDGHGHHDLSDGHGDASADGHADGSGPGGLTGLVAAAGLGGVPVTVVLSLLTAFAWFLALAGTVLLEKTDAQGLTRTLLGAGVLAGAVVGSWAVTWVLLRPLRRLFPDERPPSRLDFVGRICVVRTGRVDSGFGQAEVAAEDGSTAIIQVRTDESGLAAGATALIFDYDADGEFFRIGAFEVPFGKALDPGSPAY
ncbi:hypothetical protein AB0I22_28925 [Streptomyces sp. NPDC050610]|uniref:hypothetical protein n=1 Tax=Streptomyces sp. NPDC050610 TaxID=3157097 RepID=UPI00342C82B8